VSGKVLVIGISSTNYKMQGNVSFVASFKI